MTFLRSRRNLSLPALAASVVLTLGSAAASAQQITYYDFDAPQANSGQISRDCSTGAGAALFCMNDGGNNVLPYFSSDTYPASIDPNPSDNPPVSGTHYATEMTQAYGQHSSMWFAVPQKVADGFTAYFAFKLTPDPTSGTTADGLAFVLQNATGPGDDTAGVCTSTGNGLTAVGDGGGCMGYGGIPNSLALEFDTYQNGYDPDNNHMALQNCGAGLPNSPDIAACNVSLNGVGAYAANPLTSASTPTGQTPVTLADGNIHQIVIVYSGPLEATPNLLQIYLDPAFVPGTHTPVSGSIPVFSGTYDLTQALNLLNSGSANDSAYIGFTSGTGSYWENNELMAWTFTPHTTVTQQQPLNPPGTPTTFDFGTHSYTTNFPPGADTNDITMGLIATTITPVQFTALLGQGATQYTGSACQVYDDTGGNCIIYSAYCYYTDTGAPTACPAPTAPPTDCSDPSATDCVDLTSSYNNSVQPTSPGYLQGDPFFSPITSITTSGTTATVSCTGECAVTANQTVTILDTNDSAVATVTVQTLSGLNQFTFTTSSPISQTGGFLTSNNVQDIFTGYTPQNIDGSTTGKTKNFSDFVVTGVTVIGSQTQISGPNNNTATVNQPDQLTATVNVPSTIAENGIPANLLQLLPAGSPGLTPGGTVSFFEGTSTTPINGCSGVPLALNSSVYQATCSYTPTSTNPVTITAQYSGDGYHQASSNDVVLTVNPQTVVVNVGTNPSGLSFSINGTTFTGPQAPTWNIGTSYTLATTSPQPGATGTQYAFSSWSDGGAISHLVPAPASTVNYTASFNTQYQLTVRAGTGGTVTATNGFYNAQSVVNILATPSAGYTFSGWMGGAVANSASASTTVTMNGPETITASFTPASTVSISPSSIDFGTLYLGSIVTKTVTVKNVGTTALSITGPRIAIVGGGDSSEFITLNLCPKSLAAGKSCLMTVTFIGGPFYTPQTATLTVTDSSPGSPQSVPLTATVINPRVGLSASSLSFGTHKVGTSTTSSLKITNTGTTDLSIAGIVLNGADIQDFSAPNTCPATLSKGSSCTLSVTFTPQAKKGRSATLVITDNAQNSPQSVSLSGTGD
ncbi:MAG TPA: choice-of-anchor D domain-containing protein [Acidobacteriaceae bacterium]|nr:choice-of-anchor D domain-containing protein [Acidobacteriaceae bacterium]